MATGASNSDVGIILIDSTKGILDQTKRHTFILSLLEVNHVVIAINKMDLVNYDKKVYDEIIKSFEIISKNFNFSSKKYIPLSALVGDNVFTKSDNMPWYKNETLISTLEKYEVSKSYIDEKFSMPVQWVNPYEFRF